MTITATELGWMRQTVRRRLTSRAVALRATTVETEGGTRIDFLPTGPAVAAGLRDPNIGAEMMLASRIVANTVLTVLLPLSDDQGNPVEVRAQDRLSVTTTDPVDGASLTTTLEVEGVQGRFSDFPIVQRVVAKVLE